MIDEKRAFGVAVVACVAGKAVKIWRDALK